MQDLDFFKHSYKKNLGQQAAAKNKVKLMRETERWSTIQKSMILD